VRRAGITKGILAEKWKSNNKKLKIERMSLKRRNLKI
jgi:hypothetical protein